MKRVAITLVLFALTVESASACHLFGGRLRRFVFRRWHERAHAAQHHHDAGQCLTCPMK